MALDSSTSPVAVGDTGNEIDFASLINLSGEFVLVMFPSGLLHFANPACRNALGYRDQDIQRVLLLDIVHPNHQQHMSDVMRDVLQLGPTQYFTSVLVNESGGSMPVSGQMDVQRTQSDRTLVRVVMHETPAAQATDASLYDLQSQFDCVFESPVIGMALQDLDGRWQRVNNALADMLGYTQDELGATSFHDNIHPDDLDAIQELMQGILSSTDRRFQVETRYVHRDGSNLAVILTVSAVTDRAGSLVRYIVQIQDITARTQIETQLLYKASHDVLTGLPNRALFMDRIEHALMRITRSDDQIAVMFVDLDGFKAINDQYGHEQGDRLLIEIGRRLRACARAGDTVARLGGDEFTILLEEVRHPSIATEVAQRVRETLRYPIMLGEHVTTISPSIGIAISIDGDDRAEAMLHDADTAMYAAKRAGADRAIIAQREMPR